MGRKARNRFEILCWLALVADLLVLFATRPQASPSAQASSIFKTSAAATAPQACRPVIDQIVTIATDETANSYEAASLAPIYQCVHRQEEIDASGCPADFKIAESRFISAERSLYRDAFEDTESDPRLIQRAFFDVYAHRSPYDTLDQISDKIKSDLDKFQSAAFDLNQVSSTRGVN